MLHSNWSALGDDEVGNEFKWKQATVNTVNITKRSDCVYQIAALPHCKYFVSFAALNCFHVSIGNEEMVDVSEVGRK